MAKYTIRYNITIQHDVEIEASSIAEAKRMANDTSYISEADILQEIAENGLSEVELSSACVEVDNIFNNMGDYC